MVRRGRLRVRRVHLAGATALSIAVLTVLTGSSSAQVTEVTGSAFGARANVQLFGGTPIVLDPTPTVTLPAAGGNVNDSVPSIAFQAGPAQLLTTGEVTVSSQGTTGAGGSVTSTATVQDVVIGGTTITTLSATCTASETGPTGSTTVTGGRVPTSDVDRNTEGDETYTDVPASPAANFELNGLVPSVGTDYYRVVFNEQVTSGGILTVRAAHFYLGENPPAQNGPVGTGEVIVGEVTCGATAGGGGGATTTTAATGDTTTTTGGTATTTTVGGGVTPTTVATCPAACPTTTTPCPAACPTTTVRIGALVRTGSETDLSVAWAALALTLGGLLLLGAKSLPAGRGRRVP